MRELILISAVAIILTTGCRLGQILGKGDSDRPLTSSSNSSATANGNSTDNDTNTSSGVPSDEARIYKFMEDAGDELGLLSTTTSLDPSRKISGKIAVVNRKYVFTDDYYVELFSPFFDKIASDDDLRSWGLDKADVATTPEEIDTLVRITCKKGKKIGTFRSPDKSRSVPGYGMDCDVELIDYKAAVVFAKRSVSNNEMPATATIRNDDKEYTVLQPYREIHSYIKTFPRQ